MSACAPAGTLLGQTTEYVDTYRPDLLTPIPRSLGRDVIGVHDFRGTDVWRLYEITWINERGLPVAAAGEIRVPATSRSSKACAHSWPKWMLWCSIGACGTPRTPRCHTSADGE